MDDEAPKPRHYDLDQATVRFGGRDHQVSRLISGCAGLGLAVGLAVVGATVWDIAFLPAVIIGLVSLLSILSS